MYMFPAMESSLLHIPSCHMGCNFNGTIHAPVSTPLKPIAQYSRMADVTDQSKAIHGDFNSATDFTVVQSEHKA